MPELPIDHNEAWSLAHMRHDNSNVARCYIELRKVAREVCEAAGNARITAIRKLRAICEAND